MEATLLALGREAVILSLILSSAPLLAALAVGIVCGILQTATQVQEQSLSVVPRLAAVMVTLGLAGPWIGARLVRFADACIDLIGQVGP